MSDPLEVQREMMERDREEEFVYVRSDLCKELGESYTSITHSDGFPPLRPTLLIDALVRIKELEKWVLSTLKHGQSMEDYLSGSKMMGWDGTIDDDE